MTPSTFLAQLSPPSSEWPHYVTTTASTSPPPSSVYHPSPSYREDPAGGSGNDDYHFFGHGGLDLASSFINQNKESPLRLNNGQSQQQTEPTTIDDGDADIGDEIHLANMAFMNASKTGHPHHQEQQQQQRIKETHEGYATSYGAPDEDDGLAMNDPLSN